MNVLCYQLGYGEDELKKVNEEKAKAEDELKEKKGEVTKIETKIFELQQTKAKAEEETADVLNMQQAAKDDLNLLIKQVTSLNSRKSSLTQENAQLEDKIAVCEIELDKLTQSTTMAKRVNRANEQAENLNTNAERYNSARDLYKG